MKPVIAGLLSLLLSTVAIAAEGPPPADPAPPTAVSQVRPDDPQLLQLQIEELSRELGERRANALQYARLAAAAGEQNKALETRLATLIQWLQSAQAEEGQAKAALERATQQQKLGQVKE